MTNAPAICNGCGNESPAWDQLCTGCSKEVKCENCDKTYKRGQGLQEVNLCPGCLNEVFTQEDEEECPRKEKRGTIDPEQNDPYEDHGFDHQWELYDR